MIDEQAFEGVESSLHLMPSRAFFHTRSHTFCFTVGYRIRADDDEFQKKILPKKDTFGITS